jgi:hypothetical protein
MNEMERVVTLSNKLQEQLAQNASIDQLLITVEMLQSELYHYRLIQPKKESSSTVAVNIASLEKRPSISVSEASNKVQEKTLEVLHVDEAEMEAELEEIKRTAQAKNNMGVQNKPALLFDPMEDIPTLTHQQAAAPAAPIEEAKPLENPKNIAEQNPPVVSVRQEEKPATARPSEVHETIARDQSASINEKLRQTQFELGDSLVEAPIKDLKKAIGVNDRFLFINDLFRGDEVMYERSIKTINSFSIYPEAEYWIKRELKLKLAWDEKNLVVKQFDQLIKRRFL